MASPKLTSKSFEILAALTENNNRAWYQEHRKEIETFLREPFAEILRAASDKLVDSNTPMTGSEKTMFRQHRDVRFSKDKSPYQTHVSGLLTPSGTKAEDKGLIYLHFDVDGGFLACGKYKMDARSLEPIRRKILANEQDFEAVLADLKSAKLCFMEEGKLKSMPRGFENAKDHQHAEYLKLISYCVSKKLPKSKWLKGEVVAEVSAIAGHCQKLLVFLQS